MTSPSDVERNEMSDRAIVREALDAFCDRGHELHCDWVESSGRVECSCDLSLATIGYSALDAILKQIQTLTEERDEARGLHEMSADSVVKLRHELVEAQANEAAQIAKGLQLAAQLDEARAASTKNAITAGDALIQLDQARALLQAARDWLGCIQHFPEGCPDDCAEFQVIQRVDAFLQPSNEEG